MSRLNDDIAMRSPMFRQRKIGILAAKRAMRPDDYRKALRPRWIADAKLQILFALGVREHQISDALHLERSALQFVRSFIRRRSPTWPIGLPARGLRICCLKRSISDGE